jgi:hypothetical protein
MTRRHRPPSRVRYAETHPSITVHFDLDTYAKVMELRERSGLTPNQLIRQALGSMESHIETIQTRGRATILEEGRKTGIGRQSRHSSHDPTGRSTSACPTGKISLA